MSVSEDQLFDILAWVVWVVLPLALVGLGLATAIRSPSLIRRVVGYAVAVGGTWIGIVATLAFARCPEQDETCGGGTADTGSVGDIGTRGAIVIGIAYLVVVYAVRRMRRSTLVRH
jgi:undecaprenyl pyrophosphate phosphatase UppP